MDNAGPQYIVQKPGNKVWTMLGHNLFVSETTWKQSVDNAGPQSLSFFVLKKHVNKVLTMLGHNLFFGKTWKQTVDNAGPQSVFLGEHTLETKCG